MELEKNMYASIALMVAAVGTGFFNEHLVLSIVLSGLSLAIAIITFARDVCR